MAQFLELTLDEYTENNDQFNFEQTMCVCCLAQNVPLINLSTCKHNGFLQFYFKLKLFLPMEVQNSLICSHCHGQLKKIDKFMQQIHESYVILNEKATQSKTTNFSSLKCTQVELLSVHPTSDDVKSEPTTSKDYQEISIKKEISSMEDVKPLGVIDNECDELESKEENNDLIKKEKRRKKEMITPYVGKLLVSVLSVEEMQKEREKQRAEDKYQKRPFKCEKCIVAFDHEINLKNHVENRHKETCGGHVCKICESVYDSDISLKAHHKRHFTRFKCKICEKQYLDERSAVLHYREKHTKGPQLYQCKVEDCGFETRSHRSFRYHQGRHNQVKCTFCSKLYMKGTQLRLHINTVHNKSSVFKCEKCDKQYKQRSGLSVHMQSAHGGDAAYCAKCRRHFRTPQILARHLRCHSNHVDKKYMCDECGTRFVTKGNLKYHIEWAHLKMATYRCIQCTKVLRTSRALQRHIEFIHENKQLPRDKICHYCGKGFTSSAYLQTHLLSHTGERPHRCKCCGASFAHRAALYTHHKRHLTPRA